MPSLGSSASVINDLNNRYARGDFLDTYSDACGESGSYREGSVAQGFNSFLSAGTGETSRFIRDMLGATAPDLSSRVASDIFKKFLNDGHGCYESSPTRRAIAVIDSIKNSTDVVQAHRGWRSFLMLFENFVEKLKTIIERNVIGKETVNMEILNRIAGTVDGFEPFAKKLDERMEPLSQTMERALRIIIGVQIAATREIRSLALALRPPTDTLRKQDAAFFIQISESFLTTADDFNDPFVWAKKAYTRLKEMEKLYYQSSPEKQVNVNVKVSDEHPVLRSDDALVAKEILDHVIFASMLLSSDADPVDMNISWDDELSAMVIASNKVMQITRDPVWQEVSSLLLEMGGMFNISDATTGSGEIIIPIKTTDGMASPVPTTGPGSEPDGVPTMTGFSASGETNLLAQNLRTFTAQDPAWANALSARNFLFILPLTGPAPMFFNCMALPPGRAIQ
jgi:hypothetical protein